MLLTFCTHAAPGPLDVPGLHRLQVQGEEKLRVDYTESVSDVSLSCLLSRTTTRRRSRRRTSVLVVDVRCWCWV